MNKIDYTNKVNLMLEDEATYKKKKLKKDSTPSIQNSVNKFARKLKLSSHISKDQYNKIITHVCLIFYCLPKIDKENIPLRPIVSCLQSPVRNLSMFYLDLLNKLINKEKYFVKDPFSIF